MEAFSEWIQTISPVVAACLIFLVPNPCILLGTWHEMHPAYQACWGSCLSGEGS